MLRAPQGWRWRAVLNGVATAAVVGGALLGGCRHSSRPLSAHCSTCEPMPRSAGFGGGRGVAVAAAHALRARRFGFGGVPTLWG